MGSRAARSLERRVGLAALVAVSASLVWIYATHYRPLSPYDEFAHLDYLSRIQHGDIVQRGERVGLLAMRQAACRGIDYPRRLAPRPACNRSGQYSRADFVHGGYNNADLHPPTYYALTAPLAELFDFFGADGFLEGGRLVGTLWLALGVVVTWQAAQALNADRKARLASLGVVVATPAVLHASSTVSPDATAFLSGGLVLLAVFRWRAKQWPLWALMATAFLVPWLRSTNAVAVGAAAVFLLILAGRSARDAGGIADARRLVIGAGAMLAAALAALVAWVALHEALAVTTSTPVTEAQQAQTFPLDDLAQQVPAFVTPVVLRGGFDPSLLNEPLFLALTFLVNAWILGVVVGALWRRVTDVTVDSLALSASITMLCGGVLVGLANYFILAISYTVPSRYGLSLLPAIALVLAKSVGDRLPMIVTSGLAVASFVSIVIGLLGAG